MGKASVEQLSELHGLLCQWGIDKLNEVEPVNQMTPAGPVTVGYKKAAKAGDINALRAFLNDNGITADIDKNKGLSDLRKQLAQKEKHSGNVVDLPTPGAAAGQIGEMKYGTE